MTVDELIDWLESAKRIAEQSGQEIGDYEVGVDIDPRVDHGTNEVRL